MGTYAITEKQKADLDNRFTYHAPKPGQPARYEDIRSHAKELALHILEETPACREQSLALTHLEEAVFWSNAAIARNDSKVFTQPAVERADAEPERRPNDVRE